KYPNTEQWLKYGGGLRFTSKGEGKIEVRISDPGGSTPNWIQIVGSFSDALDWAEENIMSSIEGNQQIMDSYLSGEVPWGEDEVLYPVGLPPVKKPEHLK
ncbi:MAG: hypothetical protein PVG75_13400, partial [Thioalkalispiraceae bacterium]